MSTLGKSLFNPADFRDSCGFGLITSLDGAPAHSLVRAGIEALECMEHRGGVNADGKTGDGCGLLIQLPDRFFRAVVADEFKVTLPARYAVGTVFLSAESAAYQRHVIMGEMAKTGLEVMLFRSVPVNPECLGPIARASMPLIEQFFVSLPVHLNQKEVEVRLFRGRRYIEEYLHDHEGFYIASLSQKTTVYKGLMMPNALSQFYLDLQDERVESRLAVFHLRFSTNTMPSWHLAQPFRYLAHNGEINAIKGNRNWAQARANQVLGKGLPDFTEFRSVVNMQGSDSMTLDNMLEILLAGGVSLTKALRLLIPPAWENNPHLSEPVRDFFHYTSMQMEPWDGPAGIVLSDGKSVACLLDRNGLRPARYTIYENNWIVVSSENGVCEHLKQRAREEGRVGPGQILLVDVTSGSVSIGDEIDESLGQQHPYKEWLQELQPMQCQVVEDDIALLQQGEMDVRAEQKRFLVTLEECQQVLAPIAETGLEATGSMGDDTPMAVLSRQVRPLYDYFRQDFAQVTNPPIDSLRETGVMSLETELGAEGGMFSESREQAKRIVLDTPVLTPATFANISQGDWGKVGHLHLAYPQNQRLREAIEALTAQALEQVRAGACLLVLSERCSDSDDLVVHALLATGAVHQTLIDAGFRCKVSLLVETASARDAHQIATLMGYGATAVFPWLGYRSILDMHNRKQLMGSELQCLQNYQRSLNKSLLKILSKVGISKIDSYRGAGLFEMMGLGEDVVELCFRGNTSRIGGASLDDMHQDALALNRHARSARKGLRGGGILKFIPLDGEQHAYNPDVVYALHQLARSGSYQDFLAYVDTVHSRQTLTLRDLLELVPQGKPIPLEQVEDEAEILKRFDSAGMSLGALSPEAHEALAQAMNELGGRSNSGEGGEDEARYNALRGSKIKQVASGRFGVTPHYLRSAEVIQIKIAQGAKPGEGGQLPGGKVNQLIARLRYSVPGVTLISPPPHHDIYSIEDLEQLIYDLKQVNPQALVSVKLVSCQGVGTVAAGVTKAHADLITISGYDGGTGASPLSSIRYAGSPWELGIAEAHQTLCGNDLRHRVRLQADGGLKTGIDVVKAAALGAESFGFGTAPMVALGCKYLRICHLNNCATGVATQDPRLREEHFEGTVEMVKNFFTLLAHHTREVMASIGVRSVQELIGQTQVLRQLPGDTSRQQTLDLSPLLSQVPSTEAAYCSSPSNPPRQDKDGFSQRLLKDCTGAIERGTGGDFAYKVRNYHRSLGGALSGLIAHHHGRIGLKNPLRLQFEGVAGQSLGVWNAPGLEIYLKGNANDYVGKGMAGGKLVLRQPDDSSLSSWESSIMGNTCLYGATGGLLFAAGRAGERFAVRNSGAQAVVEGTGDHCCEYMTGGVVAVLGSVGINLGAGMTGGTAFVLDEQEQLRMNINSDVELHPLAVTDELCSDQLRTMLQWHLLETGSERAREILRDYSNWIGKFKVVVPQGGKPEQQFAAVRNLLNSPESKPVEQVS